MLSTLPTNAPSVSPSSYPTASPVTNPTRTPTVAPSVSFVPSDNPSINPPKWKESSTDLPTGHALNDDYIPPTAQPTKLAALRATVPVTPTPQPSVTIIQENYRDTDTPPVYTNRTKDVEVIAAIDERSDDDTNWKRAFTFVLLLMAGITVAIPATGSCHRAG